MSNAGPKFQYRDNFYALCPPWLTTGDAEKYMYTLQYCTDLLLEKMNQAAHIGLPGEGDPSQLPYLANDRVLVQGPAESDDSFVLRLRAAIVTWGLAGSVRSVLLNLQAYMQGLQPGLAPSLPMLTIVGGSTAISRWNQLYQGDALGALPTLTTESPADFNWDGFDRPWRAWLVLPMALATTGLAGAAAQIGAASGGSYANPGQLVAGVWIPATSGTPVNAPFLAVSGLSGVGPAAVGQWITISGSSHASNNGTFPIVAESGGSVTIANPQGVASDAGPLTWSIGEYPWIGPGLPYGSPGVVYGQGELTIPPIDTGANFGGVWQPSGVAPPGLGDVTSWGLDVSSETIVSLRDIVKTWKSARTYYPNIVVAFDTGTGVAGSAYSPNSAEGAGNPDGSFGDVGHNVNGVWTPTRLISSPFDCYCQGTGSYQACSVENVN